MRCHIFTAVWGPWHTDRFVNINLPSLLAEGNLPDFAQKIEITFIIATRRSDRIIIENAPAYHALQRIARVRIVTHPDHRFGAPIETHKRIWLSGIREAAGTKSFYLLNPPDVAWANGSFNKLAVCISAGKSVIYALFPRVVDETFSSEIIRCRDEQGAIAIPPRAMVKLMLQHLHPLNAAYLRDSDQFPSHSEFVLWPIPGEGLLMRPLSALALGFNPRKYNVKTSFLLESVKDTRHFEFMNNSDDLCGVSLTPLRKDELWYSLFRSMDIDEVGAWWLEFYDPANDLLAKTPYYFHTCGTSSVAWQRARRMSDFFAFQAMTSRECIRVGRLLKRNGCTIAAEILATALYAARLRRHWRWQSPISIIAPSDQALAPYRQIIAERLLGPGLEKVLISFVTSHVFRGRLTTGRASTLTGHILDVDAESNTLSVGGSRVVRSFELPAQNKLFIVDNVLPSFDFGTKTLRE